MLKIVAIFPKPERIAERLPEHMELYRSLWDYFEFQELFNGQDAQEIDVVIIDVTHEHFDKILEEVSRRGIKFFTFNGNYAQLLDNLLNYHPAAAEEEEKKIIIEEKVIEKEKRITDVRVQEKEKIIHSAVSLSRQIIMIGSLDRREGASFVARNLAASIAKNGILVSIVEIPTHTPYHFDRSLLSPGIIEKMTVEEEEHFQKTFPNFGEIILNNELPSNPFTKNGIEWIVQYPDFDYSRWTAKDSTRLVASAKNSVCTIIDIGNSWTNELIEDLYFDSTKIFLVMDSDPQILDRCFSNNRESGKNLEFLLRKKIDIDIIFNKVTPETEKELFERIDMDRLNHLAYVPYIEPSLCAKAAYEGFPEVFESSDLENSLYPILVSLLPVEYLQHKKEKKRGIGLQKIKSFISKSS